MNPILVNLRRCTCKEEKEKKSSEIEKQKPSKRSERKAFNYPKPDEMKSKTFHIRYEKKLSSVGKFLLNSFQNKYLYYAIDDILYSLKFNSIERDNLLAILYSPVLSLQNNLSINFFDIWINEIYLSDVSKINKFLSINDQKTESFNYITIKFLYKTKIPIKKEKLLW